MIVVDLGATGKRITDLRTDAGLTTAKLAQTVGVSTQAVDKWQRGQTLPTVDNLVLLADIFSVGIGDIVVTRTA